MTQAQLVLVNNNKIVRRNTGNFCKLGNATVTELEVPVNFCVQILVQGVQLETTIFTIPHF
jgi:hypothetical protein